MVDLIARGQGMRIAEDSSSEGKLAQVQGQRKPLTSSSADTNDADDEEGPSAGDGVSSFEPAPEMDYESGLSSQPHQRDQQQHGQHSMTTYPASSPEVRTSDDSKTSEDLIEDLSAEIEGTFLLMVEELVDQVHESDNVSVSLRKLRTEGVRGIDPLLDARFFAFDENVGTFREWCDTRG
ncbi:unnamed protein product [Sympodiomycopsis kandeliae]